MGNKPTFRVHSRVPFSFLRLCAPPLSVCLLSSEPCTSSHRRPENGGYRPFTGAAEGRHTHRPQEREREREREKRGEGEGGVSLAPPACSLRVLVPFFLPSSSRLTVPFHPSASTGRGGGRRQRGKTNTGAQQGIKCAIALSEQEGSPRRDAADGLTSRCWAGQRAHSRRQTLEPFLSFGAHAAPLDGHAKHPRSHNWIMHICPSAFLCSSLPRPLSHTRNTSNPRWAAVARLPPRRMNRSWLL
jgi:hypothetical protein